MNELNELMESEYTAMSCMDTPMSDLVSKALEIVRKKITDKEYLEIESNMIGSYNHAEKFGFEQGFMRGIVVAKGGSGMMQKAVNIENQHESAMTAEKKEKNEILNNVFDATAKLELMQTLLYVVIDITEEDGKGLSENGAAIYFYRQRTKIRDLLHIVFNGVYDATQILNDLNDM